tara:strand:- start:2717 stop:2884 length:168 start_codon:yes stop_codon:yes gene_type:complete
MYILLDAEKEIIGLTESIRILSITEDEVVEVDIVPDDVVGNYSYIDGEFIYNAAN